MDNTNDFLNKLHNQTTEIAAPKEKKDKAIMKVLGSWARKGTDEYRNFTKNGGGPIEYLADHGKRAGVDKEIAWDYVKTNLGKGLGDEALKQMRDRFDVSYDNQEYEEWWREKKFWYVK